MYLTADTGSQIFQVSHQAEQTAGSIGKDFFQAVTVHFQSQVGGVLYFFKAK